MKQALILAILWSLSVYGNGLVSHSRSESTLPKTREVVPLHPWETYKLCFSRAILQAMADSKTLNEFRKKKEIFLGALTPEERTEWKQLVKFEEETRALQSTYDEQRKVEDGKEESNPRLIEILQEQSDALQREIDLVSLRRMQIRERAIKQSFKEPIKINGHPFEIVRELPGDFKLQGHDFWPVELTPQAGLCHAPAFPDGGDTQRIFRPLRMAALLSFDVDGRETVHFRLQNKWKRADGSTDFPDLIDDYLREVFPGSFTTTDITAATDKQIEAMADKLLER